MLTYKPRSAIWNLLMQFTEETTSNKYTITEYNHNRVKVNNIIFTQDVMVFPDKPAEILNESYPNNEISINVLEQLISTNPELIIIGKGIKYELPPIKVIKFLTERKMAFEWMSLPSACRSYNLLATEGRIVVLGLFLEHSESY